MTITQLQQYVLGCWSVTLHGSTCQFPNDGTRCQVVFRSVRQSKRVVNQPHDEVLVLVYGW